MRINNPKVYIPNDLYGIDAAIEPLRQKLTSLSWLPLAFGRAVAEYIGEETKTRVPMVQIGNGEYFSCMPNDGVQAFSWFYPVNPMNPEGELEPYATMMKFSQRVDLYVWANLKRIDSTNNLLGEKLKQEVLSKLSKVRGVVLQRITSDDTREVYNGWDLSEISRDILAYPYYAMRFELLVAFDTPCP